MALGRAMDWDPVLVGFTGEPTATQPFGGTPFEAIRKHGLALFERPGG